MDELVMSGEIFESSSLPQLFAAVVSTVDADGVSLSINSGLENLKKKYKYLENGSRLSAGDRVLAAKVSGTYIVLGKISN